MSVLLEVRGLHVEIPLAAGVLKAVRDVSFTVNRGQTLALVGESGCGKSLSALAVMDLLPPRARRRAEHLHFEGLDLLKVSTRRMADLRGNMLRHRKVSRKEAQDRAVFLLEKVGITAAASRLRQYPHQLSGGLRQRVMIAMGLMCGPAMIIADEPTTALDVTIQAQILSLLASIQKEFDMGLLLITHDLGIVARLADRVNVMYCGQVVESGEAREIFGNPLHPYTQGLLGCIPIPGKTKTGEHLGSIPGVVPTPIGDLKGCAFRNRCAFLSNACTAEDVVLREISNDRAYRCFLSPETCEQNLLGRST